VAQGVERQLVMRAPRVGGIDDVEKQVHVGVPDPGSWTRNTRAGGL
jgi:hypothetical protein